jgi:hypothetical protein
VARTNNTLPRFTVLPNTLSPTFFATGTCSPVHTAGAAVVTYSNATRVCTNQHEPARASTSRHECGTRTSDHALVDVTVARDDDTVDGDLAARQHLAHVSLVHHLDEPLLDRQRRVVRVTAASGQVRGVHNQSRRCTHTRQKPTS